MDANRLRHLSERFPTCRVAVIGDFFLDKYLDVDPSLVETSIETGKPAHQVVSTRCSPGAAGTVVNNLAALDVGELFLVGFTGDDGEGFELRRALRRMRCNIDGLLILPDRSTPTYLKPRDYTTTLLAGEHERYDTKNRKPTPKQACHDFLAHLERLLPRVDAVVIIDQIEEEECGVITAAVRQSVSDMASGNPEKIFWADSRTRVGRFRNVMIKINVAEAVKETSLHPGDAERDETVKQAVSILRQRTGRPVFVTAGARGIWISDPEVTLVRGVNVREPTDPTGAGDSATAGAVLALGAGATPREAAIMANLVASITVQQLAVTGVAKREQLGPRLELWQAQSASGSPAVSLTD